MRKRWSGLIRGIRLHQPHLTVQALRPTDAKAGTKHHDRDGLYLWLARFGSKTRRKDYRWDGKRQTFTIGPYPQVRLADGRRKAIDISEWVREGIDPRSQSARRCRDAQHHSGIWSPRHQRDMREKLDNFVLPALAELPIDTIEPSQIEARLPAPNPLAWQQPTVTPLQRRRSAGDRACYRSGSPLCRDNPAVKTKRVIPPPGCSTTAASKERVEMMRCWDDLLDRVAVAHGVTGLTPLTALKSV